MRQLKITRSITNQENESLEKYLQEMGGMILLNQNEEADLAKKIKQDNNDEEAQEAFEKLTKANLRFVISVAKQYQNNGLSLSDLINEGNIGLMKAAKRFDETRGFKFISYAVWWIRQSILVALVEQPRIVRLPLNKVNLINDVEKIFTRLEQEFERKPSSEEMAEVLEVSLEEIEMALRIRARNISIDAPFNDSFLNPFWGSVGEGASEDFSLLNILSNDEEPLDKTMIKNELKEEIKKILKILNKQQKEVVVKYFGLNSSFSQTPGSISDDLDLTPERVRQIIEKAIKRLKKELKPLGSHLRSYLG